VGELAVPPADPPAEISGEQRATQPRRGRPFAPGESGNPGGRPRKLTELREAAQAHSGAAIATLAEIMANRRAPARDRIAAARELLDRGFGRAPTSIELSGPNGEPLDLTGEDKLLATLRQLAEAAGSP
jgi:hypothetical protein